LAMRQSSYANVVASLDGVSLLEGRARFVSPNQVEVNGETIEGDKVIIATGASTRPLNVDGFDRVKWHTNETIMDLEEVPESLIVIGGGPEGLEFAQMFAHFGTRVTVLVAKGHQVLRREEPEIVDEILRSLEAEGIQFVTDVTVDKVAELNGKVVVSVRGDDGVEELAAQELVLATGIRANTADLGLEEAGVKVDERGFIEVNGQYQTDNIDVYAAGDCIGRMPLETVAAKDDPAETAVNQIAYDEVVSGMGSLTELQREVLSLRFAGQLSIAETAAAMNRSEQAVKFLQHSALRAMRRVLEPREEEAHD
ncbi:MAG: FAD-dependent oxidoreductase, partial [Chloroflexi bacterium]|nr:FAD-dependent oxidoreductase [Chloroflexota bacterium]